MGTTPVGPLSPLFLDLRPGSTLGKNKHPYRNPWDGQPSSSARVPGAAGGGVIIPAASSRRPPSPHSGVFSNWIGPLGLPAPVRRRQEIRRSGYSSQKTRKRPSLLAPILANFLARSGRRASQPLFDAARKYREVGIPVEKKTPKKSLWANAPDGTWCHQALGRPTTLARVIREWDGSKKPKK